MTHDDSERHYILDLHGQTTVDAFDIAHTKVSEAWANGYEYITLIHGSPWIQHHATASALGRGAIKWMLRGSLARGEWKDYVYNRRSVKHAIEDDSMTLALRPNPNPNEPEIWTPVPDGHYS